MSTMGGFTVYDLENIKKHGKVNYHGNNEIVLINQKWSDHPMKVIVYEIIQKWIFRIVFFLIVIFKVYCADHTYTTMKMRVDTPASRIIRLAADKLGLRSDQPDDLKLCEVKSTGGLCRKNKLKT